MKNIFNFKLAKNEFNLLKTILFLIIIVYTFIIMLSYTSKDAYSMRYSDEQFTSVYMIFTQLLYYTSVFIVSVYSFKYIYNKQALDMYHSLPIKRTTLLLTKLITGYISVSMVFAIAFYIVSSLNGLPPKDILQLLSLSLLSGLFEYSCFMLVATICNGIFFHVMLTASIVLIPVLITFIISIFNSLYTFIYEYSGFVTLSQVFTAFFVTNSVRASSFKISMYNDDPKTIIFMAVLTVIVILLAVYSYSIRKSENLSSYIIFKPIRILFQSCITFIITVSLALMFNYEGHMLITYTMCIVFSIFITFITDSILNFKVTKVEDNIPYYVVPLVSVLIFINVYDNNLYGFFNTPKLSQVESATIRSFYEWYGDGTEVNAEEEQNYDDSEYYKTPSSMVLMNEESINQLIQLQDSQFEKFSKDEFGTKGPIYFEVSYNLDNGKSVKRNFYINVLDYEDNIDYIKANSSYKKDDPAQQ